MTTPSTKRRTFSREALEVAREAWDAGRFGAEWKPWRHLAAMEAGIIRPPSGTPWDSWTDDRPSQRAILVRAIRETPDALRAAIRSQGVHDWSNVIAILTRGRDRMAEDVERRELDWSATKARRGDPTPLADIVTVLRDSL